MIYGNKFYRYNLKEETQPIKPVEKSNPVNNQNSTSNNSNKNSSSNKEGDFKKDLQDSINAIKEEYTYNDFIRDKQYDMDTYRDEMQKGRELVRDKKYGEAIGYFSRAIGRCDVVLRNYERMIKDNPDKESQSIVSLATSNRKFAERALEDAERRKDEE